MMRPVLHGDVTTAARALWAVPETGDRRAVLRRMLVAAEAADSYRKRWARPHPLWGNGSLMAVAACRDLPKEPGLDDADYCRCLTIVFDALVDRRAEKAGLNRRRMHRRSAPPDRVPAL